MTRRLPRAVLFDLDDTIIAHGVIADAIWRQTCSDAAPLLGDCSPESLHEAIRETRRWYWSDPERHREKRQDMPAAQREIVALALARLGISDDRLPHEVADAFTEAREEAIHPFPGAVETLERLRQKGVRLALVTNGHREPQRRKIERFDFARHFDVILVEGEFGVGKPDERVFRHVLEQLGVTAQETWMVGDNLEWDVAGPQRLGIYGIWVDHRGDGVPKGSDVQPDRIIRGLAELV